MDTLRLDKNGAAQAAELLLRGELVAIPTDTVYGLAAHPGIASAVRNVYEVKSRPLDKALLLLVSGIDAMEKYCHTNPDAYRLAQAFWPGALTIVLPKKETVSDVVTSGKDTVGVRCPASDTAREIIALAGGALAAPSANISGWEAPTCAGDVLAQLDGAISAVVDGGECPVGEASTIVSLEGGKPQILREGTVTLRQIEQVLYEDKTVRIGITGPTGAGKSTAMSVLGERGALVLDCDKVYHELLENDKAMIKAITDRFPVCKKEDGIDRKALGTVVFSDSGALVELSAITDRYVNRKVDELEHEYVKAGGRLVVIDAIRVLEGELKNRCDAVVGIVASGEVRKRRIMAREGISEEYAQSRIDSQKEDSFYFEGCDTIIVNDFPDKASFMAHCRERFDTIIEDIRRKG